MASSEILKRLSSPTYRAYPLAFKRAVIRWSAQSNTTGKIDWRQGYDHNLRHEIVDIPDSIKDFCLSFLKKMKLNFGCFDFIVTPDDEYVFLECNPNGQWLWIELVTGYDISEMVARNLAINEIIKK